MSAGCAGCVGAGCGDVLVCLGRKLAGGKIPGLQVSREKPEDVDVKRGGGKKLGIVDDTERSLVDQMHAA
jgi:hypothetical protein